MIMPPDVAVTGLTELAVRARTDAGQVNTAPPVPGRGLRSAGRCRRAHPVAPLARTRAAGQVT
jgi:hypothetical protein